jgi:hypothetical protein
VTWRIAACALLPCACDPVWTFDVTVESSANAPLEGAALVLTGCPRQNEHDLGTVAGWEYPGDCTVTVARPGFASYQTTFLDVCEGDTGACDRSQHLDLVLAPVPAAD